MKIPLYLLLPLLTACAHPTVTHHVPPSLSPVTDAVHKSQTATTQAQASTSQAQASTVQAKSHVSTAQGYAQRNDDKAVLVLEYLRRKHH